MKGVRVAVFYTIAGILWIVLSDYLMEAIEPHLDPWLYDLVYNGKSMFYVVVTGILLFVVMKLGRIKEAESIRMGEVLNKVNNLVSITNLEHCITWANQAFLNFTGYTLDEVIGKTHAELLHGEETSQDVVNSILAKVKAKEGASGEMINYKKDGELYWTQFNLTPIFNANGDIESYISVENIITERKQKEEEILIKDARLKAVSWLNSHEIRRPVASILAITSLIDTEENTADLPKLIELLQSCTLELDHIIHVINDEVSGK
ncbi:PAS domain-containing protein [Pedobacter duraquae]|uniref:histidine kinase n=1 Tax=Pedobacter duraquae TaxID=425511 RepID=A0A4R6IL58_9SPHI|nr:PAS domain-containing protein [Pedobacter duraquae]TDO22781.1 PAS domain S-box-containing protein [Pedobacter duraquae]